MKILIIIATLFVATGLIQVQDDKQQTEDEKQIRQVVKNSADAWAAGDAVKFADQFTDDVDYTVWNGIYFNGREANIRGHQQIFDTIYKGSKITPEVLKIRFLREDVAIVHLISGNERDGKQIENVPLVRPLMVLSREKGKWRIVVFQNTPVIKAGELVVSRKAEGESK